MFRSLRAAIGFLTVLRLPGSDREAGRETPPEGASLWFPLVGLLIGAPLFALMLAPIPDLPRALLVLVLWVALTGGLHDDAWIDSIDAAFAHVSRERRLEILRDPHVGAHGVTGAILLNLARFAALASVPAYAVLVAPVVGRWAMAASLALATPARDSGLGADMARGAKLPGTTIIALLILSGLAAAFSFPGTLAAALVGGAAAAVWGSFLSRRFGGLSGDGHGSVGVAAEVAALWALIPLCDLLGRFWASC